MLYPKISNLKKFLLKFFADKLVFKNWKNVFLQIRNEKLLIFACLQEKAA